MKKRHVSRLSLLLAVGLSIPFLASCQPLGVRLGAGVSFLSSDGDYSLDNASNSTSLGTIRNDLEDDLDLGDLEAGFYGRAELNWKDQSVFLSGTGFSDSGNGTLRSGFGDIPQGSQVATKEEFLNIKGFWTYHLIDTGFFRVGPGVGLNLFVLDVDARSTGPTSSFEEIDSVAIVPMPMIAAALDFSTFGVNADVGLMAIDLDDADGTYFDLDIMAWVNVVSQLDLFAGYRYLNLDTDGTADGRRFDADTTLQGFYFGGGWSF